MVCVNDWSKEFTGAKMLTPRAGNLHHRPTATSPATFAQWAQAGSGTARYSSFAAYVKATGRDGGSRAVAGASVLDANHRLVAAQAEAQGQYALPVPAAVAAVSSLNQGAKAIGAQAR
mgnify:FL=1